MRMSSAPGTASALGSAIREFHHDQLARVLEDVPNAVMAAVVRESVAGDEPAHEVREALRATPEQQMGVVGQEGPRVNGGPGGRGDGAQAGHEGRPVLV